MIGVALVSVHMGAVRTSKMVRAGWPGPEAPQDLVPWPSVCAVATIFDEPHGTFHVFANLPVMTRRIALTGPICPFLRQELDAGNRQEAAFENSVMRVLWIYRSRL